LRVASVSMSSWEYHIIRYVHSGIAGDATSDKIDERLGVEIMKGIPGTVSEM